MTLSIEEFRKYVTSFPLIPQLFLKAVVASFCHFHRITHAKLIFSQNKCQKAKIVIFELNCLKKVTLKMYLFIKVGCLQPCVNRHLNVARSCYTQYSVVEQHPIKLQAAYSTKLTNKNVKINEKSTRIKIYKQFVNYRFQDK